MAHSLVGEQLAQADEFQLFGIREMIEGEAAEPRRTGILGLDQGAQP